MEVWKTIKDYPDYQISNLGNVKSLNKFYLMRNKYPVFLKEKILKQVICNGYFKVGLRINNKQKTFSTHRLVAIHFIENIQNKPCINHIDGDKLNNCFNNLEWVTHKENTEHAIKTKLIKYGKGQNGRCVKLTNEMVLKIRNSDLTPTKLSKIYNISRTTIYDIKLNKTWNNI